MLYYVEMDDFNRPYKVNKLSLSDNKTSTVFIDDDPTHYLELNKSKDGKCLFINSTTKEDGELWTITDDGEPKLLLERQSDIRVHVEHLRDFYVIISNQDEEQYVLKTLKDEHLGKPLTERKGLWENMVVPSKGELTI